MERVGVEIEKKYIIKMPSVDDMRSCAGFTESQIVQTYLESHEGETRRIRARATGGVTHYTETRKIRIDRMSSTEIERDITKEEYDSLLPMIKSGTRPILKVRYTFVYLGQLFEVDVYPEWKRSAVMETELERRDASVEMPHFIDIIRDVTGERAYSNAAMASCFPSEIWQ